MSYNDNFRLTGSIMKKMMIATLAAASVLLAVANQAHAGATLDAVQKKGFVQCGISDGLPGFSYADADGKFSGIDVDVCRGVAAAVFGDDTKVKYTPLTAKERFTALQSGEVDLLSRNTTWTSSRDAGMGMAFTGVTYYDGIGFLTHDFQVGRDLFPFLLAGLKLFREQLAVVAAHRRYRHVQTDLVESPGDLGERIVQ